MVGMMVALPCITMGASIKIQCIVLRVRFLNNIFLILKVKRLTFSGFLKNVNFHPSLLLPWMTVRSCCQMLNLQAKIIVTGILVLWYYGTMILAKGFIIYYVQLHIYVPFQ